MQCAARRFILAKPSPPDHHCLGDHSCTHAPRTLNLRSPGTRATYIKVQQAHCSTLVIGFFLSLGRCIQSLRQIALRVAAAGADLGAEFRRRPFLGRARREAAAGADLKAVEERLQQERREEAECPRRRKDRCTLPPLLLQKCNFSQLEFCIQRHCTMANRGRTYHRLSLPRFGLEQ
jgi:hypothetical protein